MNKLLNFLIPALLMFSSLCIAQPCLPDGIVFDNQYLVDNFSHFYQNCNEIEGSVVIRGPLTNLEGLGSLRSIEGDLTIYSTTLTNLKGLDSLERIGGNLNIGQQHFLFYIGNNTLLNLEGLENLNIIEGDIRILGNPALQSISALSNVQPDYIQDLIILDNDTLSMCESEILCQYLENPSGKVVIFNNGDGCNSPYEIAGKCNIKLSCLPYGNYIFTRQEDIDLFHQHYSGCSEVRGNLSIFSDDYYFVSTDGIPFFIDTTNHENEITNLNGLHPINKIYGSLYLKGLSQLIDLKGLDEVDSIGGDLTFSGLDSLTSLIGLEQLKYVGGNVHLYELNELIDLAGLTNLRIIKGDLKLNNLESLTMFSLNNLDSISGGMEFQNLPNLQSIQSLNKLNSVSGSLIIKNNPVLTSISGLNNLRVIKNGGNQLGGNLYISENYNLEDFSGLKNLEKIEGSLYLNSNPMLPRIDGMTNVRHIGNSFFIQYNQMLPDLSAFKSLKRVEGKVAIVGNDSLTSIEGIENIDAYTPNSLNLSYNQKLNVCHIKSVCDMLDRTFVDIQISNNAPGCNDESEVESACLHVGTSTPIPDPGIVVYPNPSINSIFISNPISIPVDNIRIYDRLGQLVDAPDPKTGYIDVSILPRGIYLIEIISGVRSYRHKVILK